MELDLSYVIEAIAAETADPVSRFIDSLVSHPELHAYAKETIQLREELMSNVHRLLVAEPNEVACYAEWITRHAHDVGYRWAALRKAVTKWSMIQTDSVVFRMSPREVKS